MTILEAITRADQIRPNELEAAVKLRWLSTLDGQIHAELMKAHADSPERFDGYDGETELQSTKLLVSYPYDELGSTWNTGSLTATTTKPPVSIDFGRALPPSTADGTCPWASLL